jgi:lipid II:glycine glycyltransferase (peptidoglycan interpeptide bridge formation enzyme)
MGQEFDLRSDEDHYRLMARALGATGLARLFVAFQDGAPISAILFGSFNGRAYSIYSASNTRGYRLGAPSLIYWRAVEQFHLERYVLLNRGGVPLESQNQDHPAHGVYFYKTRLGTEPRVCRAGSRFIHPLRYHLFRAIRRTLGR